MSNEPPTAQIYLAECFWPDVTGVGLAAAAHRLADDSQAVFLALILVPVDEIIIGLFRASCPAAVGAVCRRAGLPVERIVEATVLTPQQQFLDRAPTSTVAAAAPLPTAQLPLSEGGPRR